MSEDEEVKVEKLPVDFTYGGKTYRYDSHLLTIEQAELAKEVGDWKLNQTETPVDNFKTILKSRGGQWLQICMSFLVVEVVNNTVIPYSLEKVETEVEPFIKSLPKDEFYVKIQECVEDFFTSIGRGQIVSQILQGKREKNVNEMLLPIMLDLMMKENINSDNLLSVK